ncbi:MAG: hypothetical protein J5645_02565 [Lachnospiraceae bacterium]|nr:hypothetical protein [Lachnospiraceae bacterium]
MKKKGIDAIGLRIWSVLTGGFLCGALTTRVCLADMGAPGGGAALFLYGLLIAWVLLTKVSLFIGFIGLILLIYRLCHRPYGKELLRDLLENVIIIGWLCAGIVTSVFFIGIVIYIYGLRKAFLFFCGYRGDRYKVSGPPDPELDEYAEKLRRSDDYFGKKPEEGDAEAAEEGSKAATNYYGEKVSEKQSREISPVLKALGLGLLIAFIGTTILMWLLEIDYEYTFEFWMWTLMFTAVFLGFRAIVKATGGTENIYRYEVRASKRYRDREERMRRRQESEEESAIFINRRMPRDEKPKEPRENKPW